MSCGRVGISIVDLLFFFFNDTATTEIYTLSLHDALPICQTSLFGGKRVAKHDIRISAYGTVDELNAYIGLIKIGRAHV